MRNAQVKPFIGHGRQNCFAEASEGQIKKNNGKNMQERSNYIPLKKLIEKGSKNK